MRHLTRRTVLRGATAAAATVLAPITAIRPAAADEPCQYKSVKEFLAFAETRALTSKDRLLLVDQAVDLLNGFYVHLPLKCAMYGVNPLERLGLLRQQAAQLNDLPFHAEMRDIFASLCDMHTVYLLPHPYASAHAWLPFKAEACVENGQRRYIVSRVVDGFVHPTFLAGVEVLSWNGVPVERAAELAGRQGSNPAARHALGLARLTYRWLQWQPPPQEDSVLIRYRAGGQELEISIPWTISMQASSDRCDIDAGRCNEIEQIQKFRKFLYAPYEPCSPFGIRERFESKGGMFGYIRIFSFDKDLLGDDLFVQTFKKYVTDFFGNEKKDTIGLIIDVRDNGGGSIRAGERILQFVARGKIEPANFYFIANDVTLQFCKLGDSVKDLGTNGLKTWIPSIERARVTSATFSDGFQYTSDDACNEVPRWGYPGPVIVVTSALTYSAAEMFAAGFQDHGGMILGVDETTGGGGAGVRAHHELHEFFKKAKQPSPLKPIISRGAGFNVAFRRAVRVGLGVGKEIEDSGVQSNRTYAMTSDDLLHGNRDLKREAARLLAQMN